MWLKLVTLNRHALLQHPDLGVPWFCEGIAKQMEQGESTLNVRNVDLFMMMYDEIFVVVPPKT
jgi:hypothetical protein